MVHLLLLVDELLGCLLLAGSGVWIGLILLVNCALEILAERSPHLAQLHQCVEVLQRNVHDYEWQIDLDRVVAGLDLPPKVVPALLLPDYEPIYCVLNPHADRKGLKDDFSFAINRRPIVLIVVVHTAPVPMQLILILQEQVLLILPAVVLDKRHPHAVRAEEERAKFLHNFGLISALPRRHGRFVLGAHPDQFMMLIFVFIQVFLRFGYAHVPQDVVFVLPFKYLNPLHLERQHLRLYILLRGEVDVYLLGDQAQVRLGVVRLVQI